jgi:hypothetical protein
VIGGPVRWSVKQNRDYTRDYKVLFNVLVDPAQHGPMQALYAAGLPNPNTVWIDTPGRDPLDIEDSWAWFTGEREVTQKRDEREGGNQIFEVECLATTRPTQDCLAQGVNNPLAIPDRIRVESVTYSKEGVVDRDDIPLMNSSWEQFRGPNVEYDNSRFRVYIEMNVGSPIDLAFYRDYLQMLNDAPLWGFDARQVKFSHFEAEPRYFGNCSRYWIAKMMFDVADDFDKKLLDEGTQTLQGKWEVNPKSPNFGKFVLTVITDPNTGIANYPDPRNIYSFKQYQDIHAQPARVILNGNGRPYEPNSNYSGLVTDASNTSSITITTAAAHNVVTGDTVTITGVTGNTAANGTFKITVKSTVSFDLNGTTGNGPYSGGGTWSYTSKQGEFQYQYYGDGNLLDLGIPISLG